MTSFNFSSESLLSLLRSDRVTLQTRAALVARLEHIPVIKPQFFSIAHFETLKAICSRLIPQDPTAQTVDLAGLMDEKMNNGGGKGWRYDTLPPDAIAIPLGIDGVDRTAKALYNAGFHQLDNTLQDKVLSSIQCDSTSESIWRQLPADRFFEELLAMLAELYYSHPLAKQSIGDTSFMDAQGWQKTGLDMQEIIEPEEQYPHRL